METESLEQTAAPARVSLRRRRGRPSAPQDLPVGHPAWGARLFGRAGVLLCWASLAASAITDEVRPVALAVAVFVLIADTSFELCVTRLWRRWPGWMTHGGVLLGETSLVLLVLSHQDQPTAAVAAAAIFVWPAAFAGLYLAPRATAAHVVLLNVLLLGALSRALTTADAVATTLVVAQASAGVAAICCALARALRRQSDEDALTGLLNRRGLYTLTTTAHPSTATWSVAVMDLDGFKQVNDLLGHEAGDALLTEVAEAWRAVLSPTDHLSRTGGDEFVLIHRGPLPAAEALVARMSHATPPQVGVSAGLAPWTPSETLDDALRTADRAMYEAKRSGGRRSVVA